MILDSACVAAESDVQSLWARREASGLAGGGGAMDAVQRFPTELGHGLDGSKGGALPHPDAGAEAADGGARRRHAHLGRDA